MSKTVFFLVSLLLGFVVNIPLAGSATKAAKPGRIFNRPQQRLGAAIVPVMVSVPSGCFQMGSPENEIGRSENEVLHRLCVNGFKLSKYEITQAEFKQFVTATGFVTDAERNSEEKGCWSYQHDAAPEWGWWQWATWKSPNQGVSSNDNAPVTCVSFHDVMAYIDWLNRETGQQYRLPTEAEWEYAARASTMTARYWGNNADIACGYANVADDGLSPLGHWAESHHCRDGHFFSAMVGTLRANRFALHDMLGNVWEWTCSNYDENYSGSEQQCLADKPKFDTLIAIRGGGWNADASRVRAAHRNWSTAWSRQANLGFRLVRVR